MTNSNIFYHVTTEDNLPAIQKEGLTPRLGANSLLVGETEPCIYLCTESGIAFWSIILDAPVVLQVTLTKEQCGSIEGSKDNEYEEYYLKEPVPPEHIVRVPCPDKTSVMRDLCAGIIAEIGSLCGEILEYRWEEKNLFAVTGKTMEAKERGMLCRKIKAVHTLMDHLDWSCLTDDEIRSQIELSACEGSSFVDKDEDGDSLYQKISMYENDDLQQAAAGLTASIKNIFSDFLDIDTTDCI